MKTLRISDEIHRKLTATVGTLMAQTGKMQTYQDAVEAMLTTFLREAWGGTKEEFGNKPSAVSNSNVL